MSTALVRRSVGAAVATLGLLAATATGAAAVGVDPPTYGSSADPGTVINLTKTVSTPEIPPKPDIVLMADRTGSMDGAIGNVAANMATIVSDVQAAQPQAQFAVTSYCDFGEPDPFKIHSQLSGDSAAVVAAVNTINDSCVGGDDPEAQLNALWQVGDGGDAITFRPDSTRIVVWFGDFYGHDPSGGHTEADAIASLLGVDARVVAVSVGFDQLDATGQATRITDATGGTFLSGVGAGDVSGAILAGLTSLPVEVSASPTCDPGLSVALDPATRTVTSGSDAVFAETITVAADAAQGETLTCTVDFLLDGVSGGPEFVQTISIDVNDVTAPVVSCDAGVNPAGHAVPASESGFYSVSASDNVDEGVDVWIEDSVSGERFGPYVAGTTFKLTQAPGAMPSVRPGTGAVDWKVRLQGDAVLVAVDDAGNTATATCLVPPPPA